MVYFIVFLLAANGSTATETQSDQGHAETPSTPLLSTEEHTDTKSSLIPVVPGGETDVLETEAAGSANPPPGALEQTEDDSEQIESADVAGDVQSRDPSSGITSVTQVSCLRA